jgi:hypothetical protein
MREPRAAVKTLLCSSGKEFSTEPKSFFHRLVVRSLKWPVQQQLWPVCCGTTSAQVAPFSGVDVFLKSGTLTPVDG